MTDDEKELSALNDQAELAQLNSSVSAPVAQEKKKDFVDDVPVLGWVNENVFKPVSGKLGEVVGAAANLNADEIKRQALENMVKEGKISREEMSKVKPGAGEKLATGADMFLQRAFDSLRVEGGDPKERPEPNPDILAYAQAADKADVPLAAINAAAMAKGMKYLWDDNNAGKLERWGAYLSAPEQAVARTALTSLAAIGSIPRKDALELMSQTQLDMHDIVDHFWVPETAVGKIGRGLIGFAGDMVFDPLNYATVLPGAAMKAAMAGSPLVIGGRVITDAALLAKTERQTLMAAGETFNVIRKNGSLTKAQADEAIGVVRDALDSRGAEGLDGLLTDKLATFDQALGADVTEIIRNRQKAKGMIRSIADGDQVVGIGFRVPFTKNIIEQEVPLFGHGTRWMAEGALGVKDWTFDSATRFIGGTAELMAKAPVVGPTASKAMSATIDAGAKFGNEVYKGYQQFKTFTTRPLWDFASNRYINKKAGNASWAARQISESVNEVGIDPDVSRLMVNWLERMPTHSDPELLKKFSSEDIGAAVTPDYLPLGAKGQAKELQQTRAMADDIMAQLELKNPKAAQRVRLIREQMNERMAEMQRRNIPFKPLNPFDEEIPVAERAMGYFPHILNPDYMDEKGASVFPAAMDAFEEGLQKMGLIDKTQAGRRDRRSLFTIVDAVKKSSGVEAPLFVTDPITASYQRIQDMDNLIAQHDLFKTVWPLVRISDVNPKLRGIIESNKGVETFKNINAAIVEGDAPRGFSKIDFRDYANVEFTKHGKASTVETEMIKNVKQQQFLEFSSFLPDEYKIAAREGATIYVPEDIKTRIDYVLQRPKSGTFRSAIDGFNYLFRNTALFGTGYQGMNAFSNTTTYLTARGDVAQLGRAVSFLMDAKNNSAKVRDQVFEFGNGANKMSLTGEQLYDVAASHGILSNSNVNEADMISDFWDNVATTKSARERAVYKAKNWFDVGSLFKLNRFVAEQNDNMFRMGLFMDSLEKGYSVRGARERVETYFYDFRDTPRGQQVASKVVPFSSFAMKTAESVAGRAAKLDFTAITIPHHVNQIMNGAYVDAYEDRKFLNDQMPFWAQDQVWGPALPAARQVRIEAPFIIGAMKTFFNPQESAHPLIGLLAIAGASASAGENPQDKEFEAVQIDSPTYQSEATKYFGKLIQGMIPPSIKSPLMIAQLQTPDQVRMLPFDFISKYKPGTLGKSIASGDIMLAKNAQAFGKYLREEVSPDWLYNALFFGSLDRPNLNDSQLRDRDAMFGNIVKSQFRDLTLGIAKIDTMDRMILSRLAASQRTLQKIDREKKKILIESNIMIDPNTPLKDLRKLEGLDGYKALVAEKQDISLRMKAIQSFYYYYLWQKKSGGTMLDQLSNIIAPKETRLTDAEAVKLNTMRSKTPELEIGRRKGAIQQTMDHMNSGLMGEQ